MHFDFSVYIVNFVIKMQMARSEQALKKKNKDITKQKVTKSCKKIINKQVRKF